MAVSALAKIMFGTILVTMAAQATANPLAIWKLWNEESGRFLGVLPGGDVHAMASRTNPSNQFKPSFPTFSTVRLESVAYPGYFLVVEDGVLRAKLGSEIDAETTIDVFEELVVEHGSEFALKSGEGCYVAFDAEGEVKGPCSLSTQDIGTHFARYTY